MLQCSSVLLSLLNEQDAGQRGAAEALPVPTLLPFPSSVDFEFLSQVSVVSCPVLPVPFTIPLLSTPSMESLGIPGKRGDSSG